MWTLGWEEQNDLHLKKKTKKQKNPKGTGERGINGKTQEDQYRQKVKDVFSGQEPIAKIRWDVNSEALPGFQICAWRSGLPAWHKTKKDERALACGRGHTWPRPRSCFPSSLFLFELTLGQRTKTSEEPQEGGGTLGKRKLQPQHNNPQAWTPSLQHNHHTCYCGLQLWSDSNAHPPPPQGVFVRATPVIYSFNDKTQPSTHSSPESDNNPIRADNRDANQTGAGSSDTDVDLHKSKKYCQRLLFFHCRAKKYTKLWTECRERISQFTVAAQSQALFPVSRLVLTEPVRHQLDVRDKDSDRILCQVQVLMLPSLWGVLVSSLLTYA